MLAFIGAFIFWNVGCIVRTSGGGRRKFALRIRKG